MLVRALAITVFIAVVFSIVNFGVQRYQAAHVSTAASAVPPIVLPLRPAVVPPVSDLFVATGTLAYYPNSTGQHVPYLVYQSGSGSVATKALVFADNSSCATPRGRFPCPLIEGQLVSYFGQRFVVVDGKLVAEHVLVRKISTGA